MSAETVDQMIGHILVHEGPEYTDRPHDHGGPTKYGVTLALLQSLRYDVNGDGKVDVEDVKDLTGDEAAQVFKRVFYMQPHIDTLPSELQPMLFDEAVNMGAKHAVECLQGAILCRVDGQLGDGTRAVLVQTIGRLGLKTVNNRIVDAFVARYDEIVAHDPSQQIFKHGWENRANSWRMK